MPIKTGKRMKQVLETLNLAKNEDSMRASYKEITANKTRLQDPGNSTKILRDPEFLKDHSPPLFKSLFNKSPEKIVHM